MAKFRRATRPFDKSAMKKANEELYKNHPGDLRLTDEKGDRKRLDLCDPTHAKLREEWMNEYVKQGGKVKEEEGDICPTCPPVGTCPQKKSIKGRFAATEVKCGDLVGLEADVVNIPDGTHTTFGLRRFPDRGNIATESGNLAASQVRGVHWLSKKPSDQWPEWEVDFDVSAAGVTGRSENRLKFHRYAAVARASILGRMQSPPAPATARFGWDKKTFIEFSNGELILTVKVHLLNRTQRRPERGSKESYGDYLRRCQAVPIGSAVPAARKLTMKETIEKVYCDEQQLHRDGCGRSDGCDCDIRNNCCKFKVKVVVEFVETSGPVIHEVDLWPGTGRASSNSWYRIESRPGKSWAHEVGHLMGFYDEYSSGATGNPPWQRSSSSSIMGSGTDVYDYHLEEFRAWFVAQAKEEFKLLEP